MTNFLYPGFVKKLTHQKSLIWFLSFLTLKNSRPKKGFELKSPKGEG